MGNLVSVQLPSCDPTLKYVGGCLFGDKNYIHMLETNLDALKKTMQQLKDRRDDVLRRVSIEEAKGLQRLIEVQGWLTRVDAIESKVSDLLDVAKSTKTKRLCLFGYCSWKCISSWDYGKDVSKKLEEVKELFSTCEFQTVAAPSVANVEKISINIEMKVYPKKFTISAACWKN